MSFESAKEFREVIDKVFTMMSTDPEMGPKLRDAETPQRFEFPDLDLVVNVTYNEDGEQNLRWEWTDDVDWESDVQMTMDSDVANRYFQGKENIAMAIARRRIKTSGNVKKALALIPITKPGYARYRDMLMFGSVRLASDPAELERFLATLGPDALEVDRERFHELLSGRRRGSLKAALMDQSLIAGLGNLLVDEISWRAHINPGLPVSQLGPQ